MIERKNRFQYLCWVLTYTGYNLLGLFLVQNRPIVVCSTEKGENNIHIVGVCKISVSCIWQAIIVLETYYACCTDHGAKSSIIFVSDMLPGR